ncbi:hypothetical protein GN244_ATG01645 [Phytophthora infestans]|uniref:Uncharacterized protein n=1 Tax=Phytophthora infestans TaxID=4787 RepID=A0A833T1U4_PHYIN|nr:hypothetical protein GN244_ATG01645 [Phytophthora infestans]
MVQLQEVLEDHDEEHKLGGYIHLSVDFIAVTGAFDLVMLQWLFRSMETPTNMMLTSQPSASRVGFFFA